MEENKQNKTAQDMVLDVRDLRINIELDEGTLTAVRGVNFNAKWV